MVVCDDQTDDDYYTETPTIFVEVLSKLTHELTKPLKEQPINLSPLYRNLF